MVTSSRSQGARLALACLGLVGCQVIAGMDAREIDPRYRSVAGAGGGGGAGAGAAGKAGAALGGGSSGGASGASGASGAGAGGAKGGTGGAGAASGAGGGGAGGGGAGGASAGAAGAGGTAGATCAPATNVTSGVRLAHLVPDASVVDFCVAPAGGSFTSAPLFHAAPACPNGLGSLDVSAAIPLASGSYDVKVVAAGAPCTGAALAAASSVVVDKGVMTLLYAGAPGAPVVLALPEQLTGGVEEIRFVHAIAGAGPLDFGSTKPALPTPLTSVVGTAIPFGGTLPPTPPGMMPAFGVVDAQGYIGGPGYDVTFGFAKTGASEATDLVFVPKNIYATLYAVGSATDPSHPPQILLCREDATSGPYAACTRSLKNELVVDTFAVDLSGIVSPQEEARRPYLQSAIAQLASDVVCLTEVGSQKDKDDFIAAAKQLPYVATFQHDESTKPTDPADANGVIPVAPTTPPCSGAGQAGKVKSLRECVATHCSTIPGSSAGHVTDVDCVTKFCSGEYAVFFGATEDQRCLLCLQAGTATYTPIEEFNERCEKVTGNAYTFGGQGSVVLLSRTPFVKGSVQSYVLPSTLVRREVVKAQILAGSGAVDVYCGILGEVYTVLVPYAGPYGNGASGPQGWANEQLLQAKKLLSFVKSSSTADRVVVAGQLYASAEATNQEGTLVVSGNLGAPSLAALKAELPEALAAGYTPACTRCTSNPLVNQSVLGESPPGPWLTHVFAKGPPPMTVAATERTFLEPIVPVASASGGTTLVPLSRNYGIRIRLSLE